MTADIPKASLLPLLIATAASSAAAMHAGAAPAPLARTVPFGPYRVVAEIGRGAMGVVYLAEQRRREAPPVALKVARAAPDTPELADQLSFERQALASIAHDHVVRLFDAGTTPDGHPWLAMEYVDGEPLDVFCRRRALATEDRLELLATVGRAVQHLHDHGVVHRDLKPDNVLVVEVDGRPVPKIIDLGFAAPRGDGDVRVIAGTPAHMAPELFTARHAPPDPRSDVFALGVVLHEVLTGSLPYPAHGGDDIVLAAPSAKGQRQRALARTLRRAGVDELIRDSLEPRPDARLATAADFAAGCERAARKGRARR